MLKPFLVGVTVVLVFSGIALADDMDDLINTYMGSSPVKSAPATKPAAAPTKPANGPTKTKETNSTIVKNTHKTDTSLDPEQEAEKAMGTLEIGGKTPVGQNSAYLHYSKKDWFEYACRVDKRAYAEQQKVYSWQRTEQSKLNAAFFHPGTPVKPVDMAQYQKINNKLSNDMTSLVNRITKRMQRAYEIIPDHYGILVPGWPMDPPATPVCQKSDQAKPARFNIDVPKF